MRITTLLRRFLCMSSCNSSPPDRTYWQERQPQQVDGADPVVLWVFWAESQCPYKACWVPVGDNGPDASCLLLVWLC